MLFDEGYYFASAGAGIDLHRQRGDKIRHRHSRPRLADECGTSAPTH